MSESTNYFTGSTINSYFKQMHMYVGLLLVDMLINECFMSKLY